MFYLLKEAFLSYKRTYPSNVPPSFYLPSKLDKHLQIPKFTEATQEGCKTVKEESRIRVQSQSHWFHDELSGTSLQVRRHKETCVSSC